MRLFLKKIFLFLALVITMLLCFCFFIPNPFAKRALLGSIYDKHERLQSIHKRKIILLGGSNVSFGLDSKMMSEHFAMPVTNMAISAGLGLKFMLADAKPYIKEGDIVILSPEFDHFTGKSFSANALINGNETLLFMLFDIYPRGIRRIDQGQFRNMVNNFPLYTSQKIGMIVNELSGKHKNKPLGVYERLSFNEFGDEVVSRERSSEPIKSVESLNNADLNEEAFSIIRSFRDFVISRHAVFFLTPPSFQEKSFNNSSHFIAGIENKLKADKIPLTSAFGVYAFPDSLFFNSAYHMNARGVDIRTNLLMHQIDSLIHTAKK